MAYNPNEPRDSEGKWTSFDASTALRKAASSIKRDYKNPIDNSHKEFDYADQLNRYLLLDINLREGEGSVLAKIDNGSGNTFSMTSVKITKPDSKNLKFSIEDDKPYLIKNNWKDVQEFIVKKKIVL